MYWLWLPCTSMANSLPTDFSGEYVVREHNESVVAPRQATFMALWLHVTSSLKVVEIVVSTICLGVHLPCNKVLLAVLWLQGQKFPILERLSQNFITGMTVTKVPMFRLMVTAVLLFEWLSQLCLLGWLSQKLPCQLSFMLASFVNCFNSFFHVREFLDYFKWRFFIQGSWDLQIPGRILWNAKKKKNFRWGGASRSNDGYITRHVDLLCNGTLVMHCVFQ